MDVSELRINVDDFDLVRLGLLSPFSYQLAWFRDALFRLATNDQIPTLFTDLEDIDQAQLLISNLQQVGVSYDPVKSFAAKVEIHRIRRRLVGDLLLSWARSLCDLCQQASIECVFLKGISAATTLYPSPLERVYKDIDLLVSRTDARRLFSALQDAGFVVGHIDKQAGEIIPVQHVRMPSAIDYEFPPLLKLVPVSGSSADDAVMHSERNNLFWKNGALLCLVVIEIHFQLDSHLALSIGDVRFDSNGAQALPVLEPSYNFVYTCLKAYVDAMVLHEAKAPKLYCDALRILAFSAGSLDWDTVLWLLENYSIASPAYYLLHHARDTFYLRLHDAIVQRVSRLHPDALDLGDFLPRLLAKVPLFELHTQ